jgi:hypothetical protein
MAERRFDYSEDRAAALDAVDLATTQQANDPQAAAITIARAQVLAIVAAGDALFLLQSRVNDIDRSIHNALETIGIWRHDR